MICPQPGMTSTISMQRVKFTEDTTPACWADRAGGGCFRPGTARLGLCQEHDVEIIGEPVEPTPCWAHAEDCPWSGNCPATNGVVGHPCSKASTSASGLCPDHEVAIIGDPQPV